MSLLPRLQAGPYQWSIDNPGSQSPWTGPWEIGVVEDAPEAEWEPSFEEIRGDNLGDTIQDMIFRGGNFYISLVVQEFGTAAWRALQPYYNRGAIPVDLNQAYGDGGLMSVGMATQATAHSQASQVATFRMRARALHPNFSTMVPYEIYFNAITLAPNQPTTFRNGTRLKNVGVRFMVFPANLWVDGSGNLDPISGDPIGPLAFYQTVQSAPVGP